MGLYGFKVGQAGGRLLHLNLCMFDISLAIGLPDPFLAIQWGGVRQIPTLYESLAQGGAPKRNPFLNSELIR